MGSLIWWNALKLVSRVAWLVLTSLLMMALMPEALAQGVGYWHTNGSQIVDANGNVVRIAGVNWYGFETTDEVVHGLYAQDYHTILKTIHAEGYNTVRIPFSNQMVETPIVPTAISTSNAGGPINTDLAGLNSLQIMDKIVAAAGTLGLKVILVNHRSEAGNSNEANGLWYTAAYPESKWIADWQMLAKRYQSFKDPMGNPTVIAVDLRNEPHLLTGEAARTGSCWTGDTWTNGCPTTNIFQNWPAAAGRAGKAVLSVNSNLLIAVEGTDCYSGDCGWQGANLEGAGKYPVLLPVANRLVYSAHDYGPDLSAQSWFNSKTTNAVLDDAFTRYWGYLSIGQIAPVWLGELGTTNKSVDIESNVQGSQGQWFSSLISFLGKNPSISWTYWALNGEDSFGLLDNSYDAIPPSSLKQQLLSSIQFPLSETGGGSPPPSCGAAPAVPGSLTATTTSASALQVEWKAVTAPANCAVSYRVFRGTSSGFLAGAASQVASGLTSASFGDTGLSAATTYYYRVEAVDVKGSSLASAQASAKTAAAPKAAAPSCHIRYSVTGQWGTGFQAALAIQNTGTTALSSWTLQWSLPVGTSVTSFWNGVESESGSVVTVKSEVYNGAIAPGASVSGLGFTANSKGNDSAMPAFTLNGVACK